MLAAGSTGSKASRKQRKSSFATPGAKGKLLPGEKARLKRARVDAKRATRSEGQGFNAGSIVRELESFVQAGGDIKVRPSAHLDRPMCCCCSVRSGSCFAGPICDLLSFYRIGNAMHGCMSTSPDARLKEERVYLSCVCRRFLR